MGLIRQAGAVLTLGLVAVIVYDWIKAGSSGPGIIKTAINYIIGFYAFLMGKT